MGRKDTQKRIAQNDSNLPDILRKSSVLPHFATATDIADIKGEYVAYSHDHIPSPISHPQLLSLYDLNHIFLVLGGYEGTSMDDVMSRIGLSMGATDVSSPTSTSSSSSSSSSQLSPPLDYTLDTDDGIGLYHQLIDYDPSILHISVDTLSSNSIISSSSSSSSLTDGNNIIKQADKYGDCDGYCGYIDFINFMRISGIWAE